MRLIARAQSRAGDHGQGAFEKSATIQTFPLVIHTYTPPRSALAVHELAADICLLNFDIQQFL
jgi:hypothetical protein